MGKKIKELSDDRVIKHLSERDNQDLEHFYKLLLAQNYKGAVGFASGLKPEVRKEIPEAIWKGIDNKILGKSEPKIVEQIDYSDELHELKTLHQENMGRKFTDGQFNEIFTIAMRQNKLFYKNAIELRDNLMGYLMSMDQATTEWES